jgi:hypothetical protein
MEAGCVIARLRIRGISEAKLYDLEVDELFSIVSINY